MQRAKVFRNSIFAGILTKLNEKEYKIAVVANMSAGKSTFINALFGDSILPAYSKATTDCPIYIYSDDVDISL